MSNVSLIIPTYNRSLYLKRILDYYNSYKIDFNIIIADSSTKFNKKINKKIVSSYSNLKILYIDKFSEKVVSHHKFAEIVKYVKTKYCVFCADDDFVVPNGIKQAVDFLEKNPDYSAAHGTYISFYPHTTFTGTKKFWWKFIYPFKSITYSKPEKRLIAHPTDCFQVIYAVRRANAVKTSYRELLSSKVNPFLFGELLPDVLTVVLGRTKRLNNFYAARQAFSSSTSYWPSLKDSIKDGTFDKEYTKFRHSIIKVLLKISNISREDASRIVDTNIEKYIQSSWQEYFVSHLFLILKHFPKFVTKSLERLHAKYLFSKEKEDKIGLIDHPSSNYFKDFNKIRKCALES